MELWLVFTLWAALFKSSWLKGPKILFIQCEYTFRWAEPEWPLYSSLTWAFCCTLYMRILLKSVDLSPSVDQVSQNYHDPLSTSKQSVLSHHDDYRTASNPNFVSTQKSLLSILFERTELKICMTPEHIDTRTLKDPNMWLNEAMHLPATQAWLKKAFRRYNHIYMIVSVHAATSARIQADLRYKKTGRLKGRSDYVASGEQIYAFEYYEICRGGLLNMDFNKCRLVGGCYSWPLMERHVVKTADGLCQILLANWRSRSARGYLATSIAIRKVTTCSLYNQCKRV